MLALQRQEREAVEFEARQQAVIAQAEFQFAQQQLGLSNQDAAFLKTTQGLYDLVAVQQATGLSRQEIDQQYFDFFETQGELSFEQFVALQAQQVAAQESASQQMASSYEAFGNAVGNIFASSLKEQGTQLKGFGRQFLILILDTLQKQILASSTFSAADSIAKFGPVAGGVRAAVSIAAIQAAFGLAKAKLSEAPKGFATGVVGLDGAGTTTSDSIPAMLSKGESVITAEGTNYAQQNAPGLLEFLNTKNKFATGVVDFGASGNGADLGGFSLIAEAISRIQPVVQVSDINKKQSDYVEVRTTGTL